MSSPTSVVLICQQLVKDIRDEIVFPPKSGWVLQAMCQKRDYGCRLVFQMFNMEGKNMKAQMMLRVEHVAELGQVHEFLRGVRSYLMRHANILSTSVADNIDHMSDTLAQESQQEVYDYSENSQAVE